MNPSSKLPGGKEQGFTIAAILLFLMVLTIMAASVYRNVRTDAKLSGKSQNRVRAEFLAESAAKWAETEIGRPHGNSFVPFTKATHDPSGDSALSDSVDGGVQGRKLLPSDVAPLFANNSAYMINTGLLNGWICDTTSDTSKAMGGTSWEKVAFKVWYPSLPVNTVRISAKGINSTDSAQVEFVGTFTNVFVPTP
jgi:Tfp pilus assembly protein PilX